MCILKHLGESIEVELEYYDAPCSGCETKTARDGTACFDKATN